MKNLVKIAAIALSFGAISANADEIDFVDEASGNEGGVQGDTFNLVGTGGYTVTTTGIGGNAYLDDKSGGPGGLGVCKVLDLNNQCSPSSDDNITSGEAVGLAFNKVVNLTQIIFHNANHGTTFNGVFSLAIDGGSVMVFSLQNIFDTDLVGKIFTFYWGDQSDNCLDNQVCRNGDQFYISAVTVPAPATLALLGLGLLGAGFARRR